MVALVPSDLPKKSKVAAGKPAGDPIPTGGRKSRDREQRWDEIVLAAAGVFYEKGYEGASLQDIASAVGLLKGSIYYYIDTKEDLLFELVMRAQVVWRATLAEDEALAASPAPTRLREFIVRWMQLKQQQREWGIVAEREFMRLSPEYLATVIKGRKEFEAFVQDIIEQGQNDGTFDRRITLPLATSMVFELMKASHQQRQPGSRYGAVLLADAYSLLLIRGLGHQDWVEPSASTKV